ncbi:MAG: RsmE family RNA methyltransferase [Candidatus Gracilibacteria bacterium]|jgi:16S rRNA (uracil1498-N3)-methyltransferase
MQHFILPHPLESEKVRIFDRLTLQQMTKVLRFRKGDKCVLMDGNGTKAKATIEELHSKVAVLHVTERIVEAPPARRLRLYCAISKKPATFELILQKATELRATDLIPLLTERCQVQFLKKQERLNLIIKEACEQCEQPFMPVLHEPLSLEDLLKNPPAGKILAGDPWTYDAKLKDIPLVPTEDLNLVIGPEGGLTPEELSAIRAAGGILFQLGDSVLRMETAALASLAILQYA